MLVVLGVIGIPNVRRSIGANYALVALLLRVLYGLFSLTVALLYYIRLYGLRFSRFE